ncbi:putative nucleolar complex-associated protein 3 [Rosellinia necatrix]|uniref:Nucleolar complex-associated protein 3 n=1 Tax=Rosellinia necatrix TaxID=77044 RepID=A0A1W2TLU4_ROSNE|nr:putative nucleolar complex-associated protein 3 [Rosellinia necatrix]
MASRPNKKRKLTPPQSEDEGDSQSNANIQRSFFQNAAKWDLLEDQYKARKDKKKVKESTRLPVKRDGRVQAMVTTVEDLKESDDDWLENEGDGSGAEEEEEEAEEQKPQEEPAIPVKEQIRNAKEELAKLASVLNEEPYENAAAFKALTKIGESKNPAIITLSLVTRMAIYKDLIPGYRIRPVIEGGARGEKLSKEVRAIQAFEQALVSGYQAYVKELARYAKARRGEASADAIASIAITCASSLLTTHPHFNFRSDLINILVWKLSSRRTDKDFEKAATALITLFTEDDEGRPSFEAVSTLCRMMKSKDYFIHENVLNLFLHLRLLSEFSGKASNDSVDLPMESRKKQKKAFRTKRERKQLKEERALQKDMERADANVVHEERDRMQSECLKAVFATYFRILKLRTPHLMGAVLEGLAKYSHLINQQFFGDLLEALKDLIRYSSADESAGEDPEAAAAEDEEEDEEGSTRNPTREALLCTATAFALLAGQDAHGAKEALHLDLSFFTTHLWQTLLPISQNADLELGARSLHLPDPDASATAAAAARRGETRGNKVNLQTTTVLLIRCLTAVLLPPWNIRSTPPLRLAAFAKQLMSASLHVPEKSAQALLALLADVGNTHGRKIAALWNTDERKGDGIFNPLAPSEEGSNPFAATVWEGEILRRHYCPKVRGAVKMMEKNIMSEK